MGKRRDLLEERTVAVLEMRTTVNTLRDRISKLEEERERLRVALKVVTRHPNAAFNVSSVKRGAPTLREIATEALSGSGDTVGTFLAVGWALSHELAHEPNSRTGHPDLCSDGSCLRCRLASVLYDIAARRVLDETGDEG